MKITMKTSKTTAECFEDFIISKRAHACSLPANVSR